MDKRSTRTRDALHGAVRTLIEKVGFDRMTVAMICDEARVGRSTFYAHYPDKFALRDEGLAALRHALAAPAHDHGAGSLAFIEVLLRHAQSHRPHCAPLDVTGTNSGIGALVSKLVREDLSGVPLAKQTRTIAERHLTGAILAVMGGWIADGMTIPAEQVTATLRALARQGLAALSPQAKD